MMMNFCIKGGVWPTMITPFTPDNRLDIDRIPCLVDFYAKHGCTGLFAVCQSSEMAFLSEMEKIKLAEAVAQANDGRMQIVASGHTGTDLADQFREIEAMMKIPGIGAYVLVSNALDPDNRGDTVFMRNFEAIVREFPEVSFGMYECPKPYKRLVSNSCLREMARSGKLVFFKDTCCDFERIRGRIVAVEGTGLKLFNANTASFFDSYQHGAAGYSGVMANFHPDLYRWVIDHILVDTEAAKLVADLLTVFAMIEMRLYPISAKYHMNLEGIPMSLYSRSKDCSCFNKNARAEVDSMFAIEYALMNRLETG